MLSSVLIGVIAGLQLASAALDCDNFIGGTYEPCGLPGGPNRHPSCEVIQACEDIHYFGGSPQKYCYDQPLYEIIITDIMGMYPGDELVIKSFSCNPGPTCKNLVITSDAMVPISIMMNHERFTFFSASEDVRVYFRVEDNCPPLPDCFHRFTAATGFIHSPNYPLVYPHFFTCDYLITRPQGETISLDFLTFLVEHESTCNYDALELYDGGSDLAPSLGVYCGTNAFQANYPPPAVLTTSGNNMYLRFRTDVSIAYQGFELKWTAS